MRPTPLGPKAGMPPEMATPMAIIGLIWGTLAVAGALWATGAATAWATTRTWDPPPFAVDTIGEVLSDGPAAVFGAPQTHLLGVWAVLGLAGCVALGLWLGRGAMRPMSDEPLHSLARAADLPTLAPAGAAHRARALRPSLGSNPAPGDCGLALGRLEPGGPMLRCSWEDVVLEIMAPRAGKTTTQAVPMVLSAPGACIATSNKADLLASTWALRATRGTCWVFDPQGIAHTPQRFTFNPLAQVHTIAQAGRLAMHFVQEVRDASRGGGDFWTKAADDLLTGLLLAAALDARDLTDVYRWLNDSAARLPVQLLRAHGHPAAAASLEGRQSGAVETREGIYETARTAAQALRDPAIMAWVTPQPGLPELDPRVIPTSSDTVYAMSKDGGGSAAPLVASLVDALFIAGQATAEAAAGRLDPPMVVVLDEAANVAKIADLPLLYSHLGSRGIVPVTILQSYRQGVAVWGDTGMDTLWGAATIKMIGAGIDDPKLAEDISKLVGEHDVTVRSASHGRDTSQQLSLRRQRILPPEAIRALPRGQALLMATGVKAGLLALQPWYAGPQARTITTATRNAEAAITTRAAAGGAP